MKKNDARIKKITSQMKEIAQGNFLYKEKTDGLGDSLDSIIEGLNMLSEELSEFTVSKKDLEKEINAHNQTVRKLKIAQANEQMANQIKTEFLKNINHEIRTPLNAVVGFSSLLMNESKSLELPKNFYEYLEFIYISGNQLNKIVENILNFSKVEFSSDHLNLERFNFLEFVDESIDAFFPLAADKNIILRYEYVSQIPSIVEMDRFKLKQIINNILDNAIKFSDKGEIIIEIYTKNKTMCFEISDEGIGITNQQKLQIFEKFAQVESPSVKKYTGLGLGLTISKRLLELMGGKIRVESQLGVGSTFYIELPFL